MKVVRLRNGSEEAAPLVTVTMMSLEHLVKERPLAFYDLVMKCRDRSYQFFGDNGEHLQDLALVGDGESIHNSIRNIVLSAVRGDGMDMMLDSPLAEEEL